MAELGAEIYAPYCRRVSMLIPFGRIASGLAMWD